jgi:hypothetical protein
MADPRDALSLPLGAAIGSSSDLATHRIGALLLCLWCHGVAVTTAAKGVDRMDVHIRLIMLQPIVALIAGVLILVMPRLLNFIVAIYLIIIGVTGLWPHLVQ